MEKIKFSTAILCALVCGTLWGIARPLDIADFGAGEAKKIGKCYYVATDGSNSNDGLSRSKAFKTLKFALKQLKSGDTLYVAGGKYYEYDLGINNFDKQKHNNPQAGKPGAPTRVIGIAGEEPVLIGSIYYQPLKQQGQIAEFQLKKAPYLNIVQEYPSRIELQKVHSLELVKKYAGTYFMDPKTLKLTVHYAALEQTGIMAVAGRLGMRICGSYVHVENLTFEGFSQALYLRSNYPVTENKADHITVKNCRFFYNRTQGICIDSVSRTLIIGCRFAHNSYRGGVMITPKGGDNLIIGNWGGPTPMTLRHHKEYEYAYPFNQYGYTAAPRNHFIGNVMDNKLSFRWKDDSVDSLFISNILTGSFVVQGPVKLKKQTMTNNLIMGNVNWVGIGYKAWDKEFAATPIHFKDNVRTRKDFKPLHPIIYEAEKLAVKFPEIKFPEIKFVDLKAKYIESTSAAVCWSNPDCDGSARVAYRPKGEKRFKYAVSMDQGSEHIVGLNNLKPDTVYEYRAILANRRGKNKNSRMQTFRTAKTARAAKVLEVGAGKLSLQEAGCMALPGDTIKLAPGRHYGKIALMQGGLPGKPITIEGNGAIIDGQKFYAPLLDISCKSNIVIDGVQFDNPESTARKNVIYAAHTENITIRNCRAGVTEPLNWLAGGFVYAAFSKNLVLENNLSWGGDYPVTFIGSDLSIRNCTIIKSAMMSLLIRNSSNIKIENSIFYRQCVDQKTNNAFFFDGKCTNISSDRNVFFSPIKTHLIGGRFRDSSGKVLFASKDLKDWQQKTGLDKQSIHADPMFEDVEKGDFRLKKGSPAAGRGFTSKY